MKLVSSIVAIMIGALLVPSPARADGFIAPTIGVNFGGSTGTKPIDAAQDSSNLSVGIAGGYMFSGIIGLEEDFSYNPSFFGHGGGIDSSRVATLMTNVIVGIPIGGQSGAGIRPYASAGLGLINQKVDTSLTNFNFSSNDLGYDLGVGVMGYFATHIGVRGGVNYFRSFDRTDGVLDFQPGHLNFFRGSFGVLVRF